MADGNPSPQVVSALLISVTVLHGLALIVTSFRLWFRCRIRKLWWDDFWAALALLCDVVCMVAAWLVTAPLDNPYRTVEALSTPALSPSTHILSYWLSVLFYTCVIWFARLSIVFSVVRIVPPTRNVNMSVVCASISFAIMWLFVLISKSVVCSVNESWYDSFFVLCPMPSWVALAEVCTDTLSDAILVALPTRLLWRVKLPPKERIMVLAVFSTSILVSVVSAIHTAYLIPQATFIGGITAEFEGAISLIVCNLLVVVTVLYRATKHGRDPTPASSAPLGQSCQLTTVDLDYPGVSTMRTATELRSGFTGTAFTGTDVSSVVFADTDDKEAGTTLGSVVVDALSLPVLTTRVPPLTAAKW